VSICPPFSLCRKLTVEAEKCKYSGELWGLLMFCRYMHRSEPQVSICPPYFAHWDDDGIKYVTVVTKFILENPEDGGYSFLRNI
jgi:hypothetical protein